MRKIPEIALMGILAVTILIMQACAGRTGSGGGSEVHEAKTERIDEQMIKHIPPQDLSMTKTRTRPSMRAELSARNATGLQRGALMDVLFDFDRASLRKDALPVLETNAGLLKKEGVTRLLLEGRADEVGTEAYNIVLGDLRAKHVKSYLLELGLFADLETTSYGEDRPLCFQQTSSCYQKNRSVHFVVKE
jgi:peptidoglycan-associated lipoprotein